jgi:hypothetical protein
MCFYLRQGFARRALSTTTLHVAELSSPLPLLPPSSDTNDRSTICKTLATVYLYIRLFAPASCRIEPVAMRRDGLVSFVFHASYIRAFAVRRKCMFRCALFSRPRLQECRGRAPTRCAHSTLAARSLLLAVCRLARVCLRKRVRVCRGPYATRRRGARGMER